MLDSIVEVLPRNERELLHMARKPNVFPSYLLHKPTGQARVRIDGKDHYLGPYGSDESRIAYGKLIAQIGSGNPIDPIADSKRGSLPRNESDDPVYTAVSGPVTIVLFGHRESQPVDWLIRLLSDWASMRIRDQFSEFPIDSS